MMFLELRLGIACRLNRLGTFEGRRGYVFWLGARKCCCYCVGLSDAGMECLDPMEELWS